MVARIWTGGLPRAIVESQEVGGGSSREMIADQLHGEGRRKEAGPPDELIELLPALSLRDQKWPCLPRPRSRAHQPQTHERRIDQAACGCEGIVKRWHLVAWIDGEQPHRCLPPARLMAARLSRHRFPVAGSV